MSSLSGWLIRKRNKYIFYYHSTIVHKHTCSCNTIKSRKKWLCHMSCIYSSWWLVFGRTQHYLCRSGRARPTVCFSKGLGHIIWENISPPTSEHILAPLRSVGISTLLRRFSVCLSVYRAIQGCILCFNWENNNNIPRFGLIISLNQGEGYISEVAWFFEFFLRFSLVVSSMDNY